MKKYISRTFKLLAFICSLPIIYVIIALALTFITVIRSENQAPEEKIFLRTNGVHIDIIIPKNLLNDTLLKGLSISDATQYISFGWGDENFYLNTPQWSDLTFANGFNALFMKSKTLMHVTELKCQRKSWSTIQTTAEQTVLLNRYILNTFVKDSNYQFHIIDGASYSHNDYFYRANGSYSCIKTCNSWANSALKSSGIEACLWTPFDFRLIEMHHDDKTRNE